MFLYIKKNKKGFTIVELLVVISIASLLSGLAFSSYKIYQKSNNLTIATNTFVNTFRRAQLKSRIRTENSDWGVKIDNNEIVMFKGGNFIERDNEYDETYDLPNDIEVSGTSTIILKKTTGFPTSSSTIIISNNHGTKNIEFNSKGILFY